MLFEYVPETNQMRLETIILTLISSILGVNPPQEKTHIFGLNTVFALCVKEK